MRLQRIGDAGVHHTHKTLQTTFVHVIVVIEVSALLDSSAGVERDTVDCTFWNRKGYIPSKNDVILRTGSCHCWISQFMTFNDLSINGPFISSPSLPQRQDQTMDE